MKVPGNVRSSVRLIYEWQDNVLTLSEERPQFQERQWKRKTIVQFRLEKRRWSVYAQESNENWAPVLSIPPSPDFEWQLEQVEIDRERIFWSS
jgi:Protein of unknown function (DUF3024).